MTPRNTARSDHGSPFHWRFIAPLLWGSALNPINSSIIATALVSIGAAFDATAAQTTSLVAAVYLASAIAQPTMGKLATRFGPRRIFLIGLGIVVLAGILGSCAPAFGWLLISRVLIGIGTSAGYPTAMALIRNRAEQFTTGVPGTVLGSLSIAAQLTIALGLPLGGLLVSVWGWRAVFFINIPLGIVGIIATLCWIPADHKPLRHNTTSVVTALDPLGIALFAATMTALLAALSELTSPNWWLVGGLLTLLSALGWWETRAKQPFIDVKMLARNRPLVRTYLRNGATLTATYCVLYGLSQWMEQSRGLSPATVGLLLLPMTAVGAVVSAIVARRNWIRGPLILTGVTILIGAAILATVSGSSSLLVLAGVSVVFGLTTGLSGIGNQSALYQQSATDDIAVAAGLLRTSNYVGAIFASSVIGIAFGSSATDAGLQLIAIIFAVLGAVVVLLTSFDRAIPLVAR